MTKNPSAKITFETPSKQASPIEKTAKLRLTYKVPLKQLRSEVAATRIKGEWKRLPGQVWQYRCADGATLDWCERTGALTLEGPSGERSLLTTELFAAIGKSYQLCEYSGDIWSLMTDVSATGVPGKWQLKGYTHWLFHTKDGAVLHWYETSGRLTFGGRKSAAAKLDRALFAVVMSEAS